MDENRLLRATLACDFFLVFILCPASGAPWVLARWGLLALGWRWLPALCQCSSVHCGGPLGSWNLALDTVRCRSVQAPLRWRPRHQSAAWAVPGIWRWGRCAGWGGSQRGPGPGCRSCYCYWMELGSRVGSRGMPTILRIYYIQYVIPVPRDSSVNICVVLFTCASLS